MMKTIKKSRYTVARRILIFWTLFIGIGAVAGAVGMLADPGGKAMGMDGMLPYFKVLPFADVLFADLTFSGIALLIVNGITNITAAYLLIKKRKSGVMLGGIFGITLMLWICIQFYMFPPNFMSTAFFIFGLLQAATGYAAWIFMQQESFTVNEDGYKNIGTNKKHLVVYFSRMGYVKKVAYKLANKTGAALYEVKSTEKTDGTLGFWWCGRFGMERLQMPIEPINVDLSAYDRVTICTPIWVFALCAPIRTFCAKAAGKIKNADYILVHHTSGIYLNAAREMDALLNVRESEFISIQCRTGKFKRIK